MSDLIGGIRNITPSYPGRSIQPVKKDTETGERKQRKPEQEVEKDDSDDNKPLIDEHV